MLFLEKMTETLNSIREAVARITRYKPLTSFSPRSPLHDGHSGENESINGSHYNEEWSEKDDGGSQHAPKIRCTRLKLAGKIAIPMLAMFGAFQLVGMVWQAVQAHRETRHEVQTVHDCFRKCGYTAAEAVSRGCVFEEFDMRWEHPSCIDHELADEYRRMGAEPDGSWTYMVDDHTATEGVPINELRRRPVNATELSMYVGPGKVAYASMRHHLTHCIFRWRKQFRAPFKGTRWPSAPGWEENHIKHCMDVILNKRDLPLEKFTTRVVFESP
ncbi:hypothetical protein PpBr36_02071 [Pyricularia pennisetigena]|uniref:hypothetical protein n=1 Tax=Pyricularia pennisetigena TaxID=1578925 RepID=UPI001152936A|nr:hypothetical protein PpBr36_02071 [Pyricularia pennisetigena]TLS29004.1 hypothetical protein PpBr36_02071 [Pyricularia pennisetigena]